MNAHESHHEDAPTCDSTSHRIPPKQVPSQRIQGVALDMDGLLFDTERIYYQVGDVVLQRRGHRFSNELQTRMMGRVGVSAISEMIKFHDLTDEPLALLEESNDVYRELLLDLLRPMPALAEFINQLSQSGLPFGVATSSQRQFVDMILPTTDWHDKLAFILTGDDVTNGKPHPEMYLKAADALQIEPQRMLVLEDSGNGAAAAMAAGAITVAVPNEHTRDQAFSGAALIADSLADPRLWAMLSESSPLPRSNPA
ncbi:haloacid dehalogenase superfamily, subfamily IA, variant 3 with third motif having DD or ED [Neorhodopirellula lusitana]|uniref:Haloacid dehalogenase superfamily, subfamily IA, variant 3 with third motif having DD or ED n=1 Tax=Neorhodopirellula lusitana TaxID=445327 RepID=A0ABY1QBB3_9BACT|nr:haloacid dehalogenase superfamily, subfamily IA, variant 3 with third motif having DD or ED [Neorhodopirellula lusitana]